MKKRIFFIKLKFYFFQPALLEKITNEEHINSFAQVLDKSNENQFDTKTNRLLKLIYESVVQETIDFVGIILLIEKETSDEPTPAFIQQMKLVECFYKSLSFKTKTIITQEFLYMTVNTLENKIRSRLKSFDFFIVFFHLNQKFSCLILN